MTIHGVCKIPGHNSWCGMIQRCTNPKNPKWHRYGGRGIKVCDRWLKFENFYEDMGEKPKGLSIDRINNDGDYCPENCRWATPKEQARNKSTSRNITFNGRTQTLEAWSEEIGISSRALECRLFRLGWEVEKAFTIQPRHWLITYSGKTQSMSAWARETGLPVGCLNQRLKHLGWTVEQALTTPSVRGRRIKSKS